MPPDFGVAQNRDFTGVLRLKQDNYIYIVSSKEQDIKYAVFDTSVLRCVFEQHVSSLLKTKMSMFYLVKIFRNNGKYMNPNWYCEGIFDSKPRYYSSFNIIIVAVLWL